MGKAEKIVVLSILFLVVVLGVWSLGGDTKAAGKDDDAPKAGELARQDAPGALFGQRPPAAPEARGDQRPQAPRDGAPLPRPDRTPRVELDPAPDAEGADAAAGPGELLLSGVTRGADDAAPAPRKVHMRAGWDIVTTDGLLPTVDPEVLLHHPAEGATWESLAVHLYGDAGKALLLRHNNEGMDVPGEAIFVPARADAVEQLDERVVMVRQGETLWQVAKRTLGKGSQWREIYEANRDVISDPDYLAPGTVLTVPVR